MMKQIQLQNAAQLFLRANSRVQKYAFTYFSKRCLKFGVAGAESEVLQFLETSVPFEWSACSYRISCISNSSCGIQMPLPKAIV